MPQQYVTKTISYTSGGIAYSTTMQEAQYATKGPYSYSKWTRCLGCDWSIKEDDAYMKHFCSQECYEYVTKRGGGIDGSRRY